MATLIFGDNRFSDAALDHPTLSLATLAHAFAKDVGREGRLFLTIRDPKGREVTLTNMVATPVDDLFDVQFNLPLAVMEVETFGEILNATSIFVPHHAAECEKIIRACIGEF